MKKPSKAFVKEMEKMYPKGAVISPKKAMSQANMPKPKSMKKTGRGR
jgi:hypothetical protein